MTHLLPVAVSLCRELVEHVSGLDYEGERVGAQDRRFGSVKGIRSTSLRNQSVLPHDPEDISIARGGGGTAAPPPLKCKPLFLVTRKDRY